MDEQNTLDQYIGDIYINDMYAFCDAKFNSSIPNSEPYSKKEIGIVRKLRSHCNNYKVFHIPAAIFTGNWFAYRKMFGYAVSIDSIYFAFLEIFKYTLRSDSRIFILTMLVLYCIQAIICGIISIPFYNVFIKKKISEKGLLLRTPVSCPELKLSLQQEGGTCVKGLLLYLIAKCIIYFGIDGLIFTILRLLPNWY